METNYRSPSNCESHRCRQRPATDQIRLEAQIRGRWKGGGGSNLEQPIEILPQVLGSHGLRLDEEDMVLDREPIDHAANELRVLRRGALLQIENLRCRDA